MYIKMKLRNMNVKVYAKFTELYDKAIRGKFMDVYTHCFYEREVQELVELLMECY